MTEPIVNILWCHSPDLPGARSGPHGWNERTLAKDINWAMFERLSMNKISARMLEQDTLIRRIAYLKKHAKDSPNQIAIEVHFDSNPHRDCERGFSTLYYAGSPYGARLAKCVHESIAWCRRDAPDRGLCACKGELRNVGTPNQYPLQRLALLEDVPQWSVIPEVAFISSPEDTKWASKFESRRACGYAIATGIMEFLDTLTLEV